MENVDKLELAICKAQKAINGMNEIPDNGSCNFDEVCIITDIKKGMKSMDWNTEKIGKNTYSIDFRFSGQANRRTEMCKTAAKILCENGFKSFVKYSLD